MKKIIIILLIVAGVVVFSFLNDEMKIKRLNLPSNVAKSYSTLLKEDKYKNEHVISIDLCTKNDVTMYAITASTSNSPTINFMEGLYFNSQGIQTGSFSNNENFDSSPTSTGEQIPLGEYACKRLITDEKGIRNSY